MNKLKSIVLRIFQLSIFFFRGGVVYAKFLGVKVGHGCRIYTFRLGSEPFLIEIGNHVTITSGVRILTHDGSTWLMRDEKGRRFLYKKVIIKNNVFIGVNSIIMPGVIIEDNVIVGAGSVVTKSIPTGYVVAGNPAKIIGKFDDLKNKVLAEYVSEKDINWNLPYKKRIHAIVSQSKNHFMTNNE